ncbi:MAG TPA: LLM class flavin-dependent oxidoreductase [Chloroflexota bacterium]
MVEFIQHAEALGLDEIWLGDEGPARDPLSVLAAAAARTRSIRLGVGITNPYLRHPAMTAVAMMTIQELSAGRAMLGLGVGGSLALGPVGVQPVHPLATVRGALRLMRAVIRGEACHGYAPPATALTAPDLPLYIGSRGPLINRLASAAADGAFVAGLPITQAPEVIGWARSVRAIPISLYVSAAFEPRDVERARPQMVWALVNSSDATVAATGHTRSAFHAATEALQRGDLEPARGLMTDDVLRQVLVWGSPREIGLRLARLVRDLRPDSIGISLLQTDVPRALDACAAAFAAMRDELAGPG